MPPTKDQVLERLRSIKGPDLEGDIVDLGLVSEILVKDGRVSFSITVPRWGLMSGRSVPEGAGGGQGVFVEMQAHQLRTASETTASVRDSV